MFSTRIQVCRGCEPSTNLPVLTLAGGPGIVNRDRSGQNSKDYSLAGVAPSDVAIAHSRVSPNCSDFKELSTRRPLRPSCRPRSEQGEKHTPHPARVKPVPRVISPFLRPPLANSSFFSTLQFRTPLLAFFSTHSGVDSPVKTLSKGRLLSSPRQRPPPRRCHARHRRPDLQPPFAPPALSQRPARLEHRRSRGAHIVQHDRHTQPAWLSPTTTKAPLHVASTRRGRHRQLRRSHPSPQSVDHPNAAHVRRRSRQHLRVIDPAPDPPPE